MQIIACFSCGVVTEQVLRQLGTKSLCCSYVHSKYVPHMRRLWCHIKIRSHIPVRKNWIKPTFRWNVNSLLHAILIMYVISDIRSCSPCNICYVNILKEKLLYLVGSPLEFNCSLWGFPPTGLHFGPILGCISGSLFKQARCKIFICVLYYSVKE